MDIYNTSDLETVGIRKKIEKLISINPETEIYDNISIEEVRSYFKKGICSIMGIYNTSDLEAVEIRKKIEKLISKNPEIEIYDIISIEGLRLVYNEYWKWRHMV